MCLASLAAARSAVATRLPPILIIGDWYAYHGGLLAVGCVVSGFVVAVCFAKCRLVVMARPDDIELPAPCASSSLAGRAGPGR